MFFLLRGFGAVCYEGEGEDGIVGAQCDRRNNRGVEQW